MLRPGSLTLLITLLLVGAAPAAFAQAVGGVATPVQYYFFRTDALEFAKILPPPPAAGTPAATADLEAVLRAQASRTPDDVAWARRIEMANPADYAEVLGASFSPTTTPFTLSLLRAVQADLNIGIAVSKLLFPRPRPFRADSRVQPCVTPSQDGSYPSGHAAISLVEASVLAEIFPAKRAELLAFAQRRSWGRVVGGVHYPSDLDAGRLIGAAMFETLKNTPRFRAAVERSRAEVADATPRKN